MVAVGVTSSWKAMINLEAVHRLAKIGSDGSAIASNQEADHRGRQTAWYKISESKCAKKIKNGLTKSKQKLS